MNDDQYKTLTAAADFFNKTSRQLLVADGRLHAETLIISMGRMAGSLMYKSFGFDKAIEPGTSVFSDQANIQGPKLLNMMVITLKELGHEIDEKHLNKEFLTSKLTQLNFKETRDRLAPFFLKYCEVAPISLLDASYGAAIAAGILVHDCREVLTVDKGAALAVYGFLEGTKTAS